MDESTTDLRLLPPGIRDERSVAVLALLERWDALDRSQLMVYRIASITAAALPFLGWQFDVMGLKGWDAAATEVNRRVLLARAVELKRHLGTPWAVKEALRRVGFTDVDLEENVTAARYDGQLTHNGLRRYESGDAWARYSVHIGTVGRWLTTDELALVAGVARTYANVRSRLWSIVSTRAVYYDGKNRYDGTVTHTPLNVRETLQ